MKMNKATTLIIMIMATAMFAINAQGAPKAALRHSHDVRVAASDSHQADKAAADMVCSGHDDQNVIQRAIDALDNGGTVYLAAGNHDSDTFHPSAVGPDYARKLRLRNPATNV